MSAISNGQWFGVGMGNSQMKEGFLSDAQTDFIFAIITEELGIIFSLLLISAFSYIVFRCFMIGRIARQNEHIFGYLVSYGTGVLIALHVFINIGVSIGLLPTKGITLPLVSFGGSNLMLMFVLIALVQKIKIEINFSNKISV